MKHKDRKNIVIKFDNVKKRFLYGKGRSNCYTFRGKSWNKGRPDNYDNILMSFPAYNFFNLVKQTTDVRYLLLLSQSIIFNNCMNIEKIPCVICCSKYDLQYLFEYSLKTSLCNIPFINEVFIVTPDTKKALSITSSILPNETPIHFIKDKDCLSEKESKMCGWSKQQIIKLRSNEITQSQNILSLGSDTITLKKISLNKFYNPENIIINYRIHKPKSNHYKFETERVKSIYNLFDTSPSKIKGKFVDLIFDVFLFKSNVLTELNKHLIKKLGANYSLKIFPFKVNSFNDMKSIGEWSLYTIFAIEILNMSYVFQNGTTLLRQIHTEIELKNYDFQNEAVHFVRKDFDKDFIFDKLKAHNII